MERLDLKKLMRQNQEEFVDNTDGIRRLKHSDLILSDVQKMETIKTEFSELRKTNPEEFSDLCKKHCSFLYRNYTDLFNRQYKETLDTELMTEALLTLKKIENGEIDQQEGSIQMGKLLYKVFVSSAISEQDEYTKREADIQSTSKNTEQHTKKKGKEVSWVEYKTKHLYKEDNRDGKTPQKKKQLKGRKKK